MTLAIAIMGLVLAAVSLGWQILSYVGEGPRVQVKTSNSFPTFGNEAGDWHVTVTAVNRGRSPTTVQNWGFRLPDGGNLHQVRPVPWSTQLPHRLGAHASADFSMPTEGLLATCRERKVRPDALRSWVRLGTGKVVFGPPPPVSDD